MTRAEKKSQTRAKALEAARQAFRSQGYEAVTIRSLAKAIGMSTGAIFASFSDKAHLFREAMGEEPPDVPAFLTTVAVKCAGYPGDIGALAVEAERLRRQVAGA